MSAPPETLVFPWAMTGEARPSPHCPSRSGRAHRRAGMGPLLNAFTRGARESGKVVILVALLCVRE